MPPKKKTEKPATTVTTEIVKALPGEQAVDEALVDQVVTRLNRIASVKGIETARDVGEVVLGTMFGGDSANFRRRGEDHVSFRALAARAESGDLHVSHIFIWRAVSVIDQLRLLPENVRDALPYTHQTLLLPVKDEKAKVRLAEQAAEGGWSKRKMEEEVQKIRAKEKGDSKAGRPALPMFVKGLTRLTSAVKLATSAAVTGSAFATYSPNKARVLLEDLDGQIAALQTLKGQIAAAIVEWEDTLRE